MGQLVICLSYRRPDLFARLAASIAAALPSGAWPVQCVLVNNGGCAETATIAHREGWAVLEPEGGANLSFAAGNNRAVRGFASEGIYTHAVLANNDAVLDGGCLAALWAARAVPIVGCAIRHSAAQGGAVNHLGGTLRPLIVAQGTVVPWPVHLARGAPDVTPQAPGTLRLCPWVTFAVAQLDLGLWRQLGGLDEGYVYSHEDVDYCLRAPEAGAPSAVALDARVIHDEGGTRRLGDERVNCERFVATWLATGRLARLFARATNTNATGVGAVGGSRS